LVYFDGFDDSLLTSLFNYIVGIF